jgi:hypothetical protein
VCPITIPSAGGELKIWFWVGMGKKSLAINDSWSIEIVKTPWYYFSGIKSMPGGWMYNIAPGREAQEQVFMNGGKIRLGTNRPKAIMKRIEALKWSST